MLYSLAYASMFAWAHQPSELRVLGDQVEKVQVETDKTVVN